MAEKFAAYADLIAFLETTIEREGVSVDNNGIGAYEYWGTRCHDRGSDFLVYNGARRIVFPTTDIADDVIDEFWDTDYLHRFDEGNLTVHILAQGRLRGDQFVIEFFEADEQGIPYRH